MYNPCKSLYISTLIFTVWAAQTKADVVQVNSTFSSGHYVRGIELADDGPAVSLNVDWSADNGLFAGAECFQGDASRFSSFERGCISYLGYFKTLNSDSALSAEITHYDYNGVDPVDWDTQEFSLYWHYKNSLVVSLSYSDDWLARNTSTTAIDVSYRLVMNDNFSLLFEGGYLRPTSNKKIQAFSTTALALEYQHQRWGMSLKASVANENKPFNIDRPELIWSTTYQFY